MASSLPASAARCNSPSLSSPSSRLRLSRLNIHIDDYALSPKSSRREKKFAGWNAKDRLAATRDRAETAERAAREVAENLAAQRLEHARLEAELRQEFRNTSNRQTSLIDKIRLDLAQSVAASKELENHLGAARALSESLYREIDRLLGEANQLKDDLATARTEIETANREMREATRTLHTEEIEGARLRTALHAKEEALQAEIARRVATDNAVAELRAQLRTPS